MPVRDFILDQTFAVLEPARGVKSVHGGLATFRTKTGVSGLEEGRCVVSAGLRRALLPTWTAVSAQRIQRAGFSQLEFGVAPPNAADRQADRQHAEPATQQQRIPDAIRL